MPCEDLTHRLTTDPGGPPTCHLPASHRPTGCAGSSQNQHGSWESPTSKPGRISPNTCGMFSENRKPRLPRQIDSQTVEEKGRHLAGGGKTARREASGRETVGPMSLNPQTGSLPEFPSFSQRPPPPRLGANWSVFCFIGANVAPVTIFNCFRLAAPPPPCAPAPGNYACSPTSHYRAFLPRPQLPATCLPRLCLVPNRCFF